MGMTRRYAEHWQLRKPAVRGDRGVVATQHHVASEVGAQVLRSGGNAVDAAVSAGLAIGAVEPWMSGIGGGGYMTVHLAGEDAVRVVEFGMRAPLAATAGGLSPRRGNHRRGHLQLARGGGGRERRGSAGRGDPGLRQGRGARARDLRDAVLGNRPSSRPAGSRKKACPSIGMRRTGSRRMRGGSPGSARRAASTSPMACRRRRRPTAPSERCGSATWRRPIAGCRRSVRRTVTGARSLATSRRTSRRSGPGSGSRISRTTAPFWRNRSNGAIATPGSRPRDT